MPTLLFLLPVLLYAPVRPEFCVLVRILRCVPCALSVSFVVFILCALCMYPCVLFISVQCVRALSLFVCCYSCALCMAYSRVFSSAMYPCILCCDPTLCLSPTLLYGMGCSFCVLYVSVHAIYFSTMCVCSISSRVLLFLVLCEAYPCVFLCYISCIPACIL